MSVTDFVKNKDARRNGQVMIEYVIALIVTISLTALLTLMLHAVRQNGARVTDIVASEYP